MKPMNFMYYFFYKNIGMKQKNKSRFLKVAAAGKSMELIDV